jgi:Site-specific recombinase XerD
LLVGGAGFEPATPSVWAACEAYVEQTRAERGDQVANETKTRLVRLVKSDPIGRIDLAKLATHHVNGWRLRLLTTIRTAGGSDASFNRNATFLRAALNFAKRQKRVASDQAWAEELKPIEGAGTPRRLYLDLDKRRRLIGAASEGSRPFFTALALQPMRPGELARCQVEHLDVEHRMLRVPGGKTGARDVPLSSDALQHFESCARNKLPQAWLVSRTDGSQWRKEAWRDEMKEAAARAKLPSATVAGTLRHSTITDLVVDGLDLFTVAKLAGTSIAMIEKTYGKLRSDRARDALQTLSLKSA